jgi:hypothetical protein
MLPLPLCAPGTDDALFPSAIDHRLADKRSPTLSQMIDFVIAGLSTPADQPVS